MNALKVHVSGVTKEFTSKAGNPVRLFEVYVFLPSSPYPEKIDVFGDPVPAGEYAVPLKIDVYNGRLSANLDFKQAKVLENK
ncbi:MAG: single-stranded DNA-binding protein [Inoviridae sp.]|nr:MAG: single-stranded DNA-binding protein [Inoviridae sp.]